MAREFFKEPQYKYGALRELLNLPEVSEEVLLEQAIRHFLIEKKTQTFGQILISIQLADQTVTPKELAKAAIRMQRTNEVSLTNPKTQLTPKGSDNESPGEPGSFSLSSESFGIDLSTQVNYIYKRYN